MRKVIDEGIAVCLECGDGLDGALIDFEVERNEAEPDCDVCESQGK
jgi:hypothetical protein